MTESLVRPVLYAMVDIAIGVLTLVVIGLPLLVAGAAYWFLRR